ncbi:MAG: hypothetical protein AABX03_03360 [Nanoarchaeota archaeon]
MQQYTINLKNLPATKGLVTNETNNNRAIEVYEENDSLIEEMKHKTVILGNDIQLAKKITFPHKYKVDLSNKYEDLLNLDLRIINELESPANDFTQIMDTYWIPQYLKLEEIINNIKKDENLSDQTNMQKYLDELKKINKMHKIYEEKITPTLDEIYRTIPNNKKDYRVWIQHEADYYLYWEKYCEAIVNKDNKNYSYYADKINSESDWLVDYSPKKTTEEIQVERQTPWNTIELPKIEGEIKKIWNEIYLLKPFYL